MADTTPPSSGMTPDPDGGFYPTPEATTVADHGSPPEAPIHRPGLVRSRDERVIAGVAGGLAATWGTHPWLVRGGFIVTTALAGLGIVLYLLGWLLMPAEGDSESIAQRIVRRMNVQPTWVGFLLLMAGALVLAGIAGISGGVLVAAGLLVGGYVLYRGDFTMPDPRPPQTDATAPQYVYQRATRPPRPPRPRSYLGRLTVGAMFVTLGVMGALDALDLATPTSRHYAAAALLVIGCGLLVGTILGRSRGLIFLGILLLPLLAVAAISDFRFGTNFEDVDLRPASVDEMAPGYSIAAGHLHLDLSRVDFAGRDVALDADVGVGDLTIVVPPTVTLEATANTRLGDASVAGQWSSGLGVEVVRTVAGTDPAGGRLVVDADIKMGSISIHRGGFGERFDGSVTTFGPVDELRNYGRVFEVGGGSAELAPRSAGEVAEAYILEGGRIFLDLTDLTVDETIQLSVAGNGAFILGLTEGASVTITSVGPVEGPLEDLRIEGGTFVYEQPGFGPRIFVEGYGPSIRVESGQ